MNDDWRTAKLPANYTAARKALETCETIDGCLEWKNVAAAAASYARQSRDTDLMDKAVAIRNRARRRIGELLNGVKPVAGVKIPRGGYATNGRTAVAKSFGISGSERKTAMRLAAMPKAEFDRRETDPDLGNVRGSKVASATLDQVIKCPHCGKRIII